MLPAELSEQSFHAYPPHARAMAVRYLDTLRSLPLCLLAALLREMIILDWLFPAERRTLESQCDYLASLSKTARSSLLQGFDAIVLPLPITGEDWVNHPQRFLEKMSAQLWASHQMDAFHKAAENYADATRVGAPDPPPSAPRLAVAVLDSSLLKPGHSLFRKLRPEGAYFSQVNSNGGFAKILDCMRERSRRYPADFAHWCIDGTGQPQQGSSELSTLSWAQSTTIRQAVLQKMQATIQSGTGGPEMLRTQLAEWASSSTANTVADAVADPVPDPIMDRFTRSVYAEGSGTQIFSTVFAQWAAREALRRAQPVSLIVRFGARQRQQPMNAMLAVDKGSEETDPAGSLVDADMAAYYTWVNLTRLSGSEQSRFLAWSEGYNQAVAIGPGLPRGTESSQSIELDRLLNLVSSS
jgi:hypothetical protein